MKRMLRLFALFTVLVMLATACTSGDDDAGDDGGGGDATSTTGADIATATTIAAPDETGLEITRGGEISVGIVSESTGWYPPSAETAFSAGFLVMDALYDRWFHQSGTSDIVPVLAEEMATPNDDFSEWTMKIRQGVKFHDGTDLNAQAAADMIVQWLEGPFAASSSIADTRIDDEYTITYILKEPSPAFMDVLTGIASGSAFSPTAGRAFGPEDSVENPIGTGPYMFESWTRDSEMVVVRNPNYWRSAPDGGTLPYVDRIRFRVLSDGDARRASFQAGDLDIITQGGSEGGQALVDEGAVPYEFIGNGAGIIIFNTVRPPFDDVRMRRAAAHALNPENSRAIGTANLSGVYDVRTQYFSSTSKWYDEDAGKGYALFDLAEAQRLADEYVNDPDRSDGKAVGEAVNFTYDCNAEPQNLDLAQLYQQEWGDIGFDVDITTTEQSSFVTKVVGTTSEPLFEGDFQIACWADGNGSDPLELFRTRYGDNQVLNWTNYASPQIDAQLDILRSTTDFDIRKAATAEISRITADDMATIWGSSGATLVLTQPDINGLETYSYPDGGGSNRMGSGRVWWHEVWVDDAEPLTDIPTGFVDTPDAPVTTTTEVADVASGTNADVAAAMPDPPAGLTVGNNDEPLADLCPGVSLLGDIEPISATHQQYVGDATLGPFPVISIYELNEGEADAIIGRYDQAVAECADFESALADGTALALGYVERDFGSFGDETHGYGVAGDAGGFPIDTDIVLIKTGPNLAVVTSLHILSPADGSVTGFAEPAAAILDGLG